MMGTREALYRITWKIQGVITPGLKYSQVFYEEVLRSYVTPQTRWLDLGCGHQVLRSWRKQQEEQLVKGCQIVVGVDYDFDALKRHPTIAKTARSDIAHLPFRDASFDFATANMVVEHLDRPALQFIEIARVLRPGGLFVLHTPNALGYATLLARLIPSNVKKGIVSLLEGREEEDVYPAYYRANSEGKIARLAETAGFDVVEIRLLTSSPELAVIPPLAIPELIWIRLLMTKRFRALRTNILAVLKKKG